MQKIPPWVRGPYELLQHAEEHYKNESDLNRRIALVGFDNAIEVAITTYLQLNPKLRNGTEYPRERLIQWTRSYHSKIDFLEYFLKENELDIASSTTEIIWYHTIRNEMYHSGNGVVPEKHCIEGIRTAAIEVIDILYNVDVKSLLSSLGQFVAETETAYTIDSKLIQFLKTYTALERTIYGTALSLGVEIAPGKNNPFQIWIILKGLMGESISIYEEVVKKAISIRNEYLHNAMIMNYDDQEIIEITEKLDELIELMQLNGFSFNILHTLKERYGDWVKQNISFLRIVQKMGNVFIEVTYKYGLSDEEIKRINLDFIMGGDPEDDELMFPPTYNAQYNAERFFNEMDLYSIIMTGIGDFVFTEEGLIEASAYCGANIGKPLETYFRRD